MDEGAKRRGEERRGEERRGEGETVRLQDYRTSRLQDERLKQINNSSLTLHFFASFRGFRG